MMATEDRLKMAGIPRVAITGGAESISRSNQG
jgi:hypothetical protein